MPIPWGYNLDYNHNCGSDQNEGYYITNVRIIRYDKNGVFDEIRCSNSPWTGNAIINQQEETEDEKALRFTQHDLLYVSLQYKDIMVTPVMYGMCSSPRCKVSCKLHS